VRVSDETSPCRVYVIVYLCGWFGSRYLISSYSLDVILSFFLYTNTGIAVQFH
jgi:hypothetical protein